MACAVIVLRCPSLVADEVRTHLYDPLLCLVETPPGDLHLPVLVPLFFAALAFCFFHLNSIEFCDLTLLTAQCAFGGMLDNPEI